MNRATPPVAAAVSVPVSVPEPFTAATMEALLVVTRLSAASRISTTGCVVRRTPATAPAGCVVITTLLAAPGLTVTDTAPDVPPLVAVMVADPALAPTTCPVGATVATAASLELQVNTAVGTSFPLLSR